MPRIQTSALIERMEHDTFSKVILRPVSGGSFCLLLDCSDGIFIHENPNGEIKEYPQVRHALEWLERFISFEKVLIEKRRNNY